MMDTPYLLKDDWKYYLSGMLLDQPDIELTVEQVYRYKQLHNVLLLFCVVVVLLVFFSASFLSRMRILFSE